MPEWQRAVRRCTVVERDEGGRLVDWEIDPRLRSISYRLRYAYEERHSIECRLVEGDVEDVRASYEIAADGRDRTVVSLALRVRPGVPVPGRWSASSRACSSAARSAIFGAMLRWAEEEG